MLPKKFTELMTIHADDIVSRTVADIRDHPRTRHYHGMPAAEMKKRIMGIFKNMEHYLEEGDIKAIYEMYRRFGRTRYYEGIPLPDLMYAFTLVKHHIRDFIKTHMLSDKALQLHRGSSSWRRRPSSLTTSSITPSADTRKPSWREPASGRSTTTIDRPARPPTNSTPEGERL